MITLITGTPGAGKTLYAVAEELPKFKDRLIFVDGIPGLNCPELQILEPVGSVESWNTWIPDGAVLVIDEVQRIWRPRSTGSAVPPGVAALETHRHKGVDVVIITQHPNLLDPNIRRLVGRHLHVRRVFGWKRAIVYEWDSASDPARVATAIKRSWGYPKRAFDRYTSSVQHTARTNRLPFVVVAAGLAILAVPAAAYYAYSRTALHLEESENPTEKSGDEAGRATAALAPTRSASLPQHSLPARIVEALTPTDDHNPLSAPIYSAVVPAVVAPVIQGCIASASACSCYSQQSTPVWLPDEQCRQRAAGRYFDPYRQPPSPSSNPVNSPKNPIPDSQTETQA